MTVIGMSRPEIDRVHILRDVVAERITVREAAQLLRITRRQVFRLLKAYHAGGPAALVSSRRGKPSNRSYPAALRTEVLALITANYADFGPTLACEKLAERHGIALGVETIRRWMIAAGSKGCTSRAPGATASANSSRSMAPSTPGLRIAARPAHCWSTLTMPPAG